tara:strand:+ start:392 stop:592 length:201 start_codon:yes stop_codon:yes gene_type:complete
LFNSVQERLEGAGKTLPHPDPAAKQTLQIKTGNEPKKGKNRPNKENQKLRQRVGNTQLNTARIGLF